MRKSYKKLLYKHSPLKKGLIVKDEDETYRDYNQITKRIFLGNAHMAKNADFFTKHNIQAVLNCTTDIPNYFRKSQKIEYMRIPLEDSLKESDLEKMYNYFPVICESIHKKANIEKKNIYVHCWAGRQRSVVSVLMYLVSQGMKPEKALKLILEKRPEALHFGLSFNFERPFI